MLSHLKKSYYQIEALVIKDFKLNSRYKIKYLMTVLVPFTSFLIPFLIFRKLFDAIGNESFGIWTPENYIIFILTGVFIVIILSLLSAFGKNLLREKYYKTLAGLFISPASTGNFLISKLISELIIFAIPLALIFIICFMITGASILTMIFFVIIYLMACLFIASIGLAIGSFRMSIEGDYNVFFFFIKFFLIFSCYKYPREFFPEYLQFLIDINPFYYFWDLMRILLVLGFENVILEPKYAIYWIVVFLLTIITPVLSIMCFNYIYKKYGITGY